MLDVACPGCRRVLTIIDERAARKGTCPHCGHALTVQATVRAGASAQRADVRKTLPPAEAATVAPPVEEERGETHTDLAPLGGAALSSPLTDFLAPPQAPDEIGRLGPYRVLKVLGAGGMGVVYRAEDPHLQRLVALKVMLPSLAASATARERFLREARAAAAVEHDNVVAIYQVGEDRGVPYLAMPLLKGEPLDERLKRERRASLAEALRIARETAAGLEAARQRGLIHRDIKPGNLWLEEHTGRVKILDFGLARAAGGDVQLTQQGAILGTPAYMAPEQAGGTADHRADLFSLGCVLYRMTTGEHPFKGVDTISTLMAVATMEPPRPNEINPALPAALSDLIMRMLCKKPEGRPASAQAVVEAIRAIEADPTQVFVPRQVPSMPAVKPVPKPVAAPAPRPAAVRHAAVRPAAVKALAPVKKKKGSAGVWIGLVLMGLLAAAALAVGGYLLTQPWPAFLTPSLPVAVTPEHPGDGPSPPVKGEEGWQSLFNGRDLEGWTALRGVKSENWGVKDGVLFARGLGTRRFWLLTDQEYGDFELRLEYRLTVKAVSGVGLRATNDGFGDVNFEGLELQIIDEGGFDNLKPRELNGALFGLAPPTGSAAHPVGEWNRMHIEVRGRQLTEKINDVIVLQADLDRFKDQAVKFPAVLHSKGRIGLQSHTGRVEFRKLFVRPLTAKTPEGHGGGVGP